MKPEVEPKGLSVSDFAIILCGLIVTIITAIVMFAR